MALSKLSIGLLALGAAVAAGGAAWWGHGNDGLAANAQTPNAPLSIPPTVVGMNLSPLSYWTGERPFADPIQSNARFYIELPGTKGAPLVNQVPLDSNGLPTAVPKGTVVVVAIQEASFIPSARHDCRISAGWSVAGFNNSFVTQNGTQFRLATMANRGPVTKLNLTAQRDGAALSELKCTPNPVNAASGPFNPALLDDLRPFGVLRFMKWMRAEYDPPNRWAARPTPRTRSQAEDGGVALEHMVDLAARLGADPWFTVPLDADDSYNRNFATYVRDHLPRGRRAYVEVSNEVWNAAGLPSKEAGRQGRVRYPNAGALEAADFYYADRVRAVMAIWGEVFGAETKTRVVRVLAGQAAYSQRAINALEHNETWRSVDALAIAPYFGNGVQSINMTGDARLRELAARGPGYVDKAIADARTNKLVAAKYGLSLVAYEAGPDFIGYDPVAKADAEKWRQSPALSQLYQSYLARWRREIGGLIVLFDATGNDGYGHKLYTGQPLDKAPLMKVATEFAVSTQRSAGGAR